MRVAPTIRPGIVADETPFSVAGGGWKDSSLVRFPGEGGPESIKGWEAQVGDALGGVCRGGLPWTDNLGALHVAYGTHLGLEVFVGGELYDITPLRPPVELTDPFATTVSSAEVTVTHAAHGMEDDDEVIFDGATAVGGLTIDGTYSVTVVDDDSYTITHASEATSTATGGGTVSAAVQLIILPGSIDGTGTVGFGTGSYGVGEFSEPSTEDYYPRTWSFATWGQNLIACPRGGTIFAWDNDTDEPAAAVPNAPARVEHAGVAHTRQVMAFGCNEESSGTFNPLCIRWTETEDREDWTTSADNLAGEVILEGGGRIVAHRFIGDYCMVWTDNAFFVGIFTSEPENPWRFERMGDGCGLVGPNAVTVIGGTAYWLSRNGQFLRAIPGGAYEVIPCDVRKEVVDNVTPSQHDKIVCSGLAVENEVWWFYPDTRDGTENSRAVSFSLSGNGAWAPHRLARTFFVDAGPGPHPIGVDLAGTPYWHERGHSANGEALPWYLESADQYADNGEALLLFRRMWPDFRGQLGGIKLTLYGRREVQGQDVSVGPLTISPATTQVNFFLKARVIRFRLEAASYPTRMRLGKPAFDVGFSGKW